MPELNIRDENAELLSKLLSLPTEHFERAAKMTGNEAYVSDPENLEKRLNTEIPEESAHLIVGFGSTFAILADQRSTTVESVIAATRRALEKRGWDKERLNRFDELSPLLSDISKSKSFFLGAKANELFRTTGLHLHRVRSVVDVRPLFNDERTNVLANIVFTNLALITSTGEGDEKPFNVMLDYQDLKALRDECERALRKIDVAVQSLSGEGNPQVVVFGKDD